MDTSTIDLSTLTDEQIARRMSELEDILAQPNFELNRLYSERAGRPMKDKIGKYYHDDAAGFYVHITTLENGVARGVSVHFFEPKTVYLRSHSAFDLHDFDDLQEIPKSDYVAALERAKELLEKEIENETR